ncbi:MAG: sporulation initiation factor Spo0A C-terminal domain-containing protein [Ruminococcus sp.]|nr:sporulation initiation factor Spo0A C-terminal domain-containing protein [Ruminococcus sp.]
MLSELKIVTAVNKTSYGRQLNKTFDAMGFDIFKAESDPVLIEIEVVRNNPDVVILNSDNMDFDSIERLSKHLSGLEKPPYIFALYTYESSDIDRMSKLNNLVTIEMPIKFTKLCDEIQRIHSMTTITLEQVYTEINEKIVEILTVLKFSSKMFGYMYIREALFVVACSGKAKINFSRDIYPEVAKKFNSNTACVERAIRVAINKAWSKMSVHIKKIFFSPETLKNHEKPTNNEFILTIGNYIHDEYQTFLEKAEKAEKVKITVN